MGLLNELTYMSRQLGQGSLPYLGNEMRYFANQVSQGLTPYANTIVNPEYLRPDYSGAGERARRFEEYRTGRDIPGANTDYSARLAAGNAAAAERDYQQKKSQIAQLTAQDPELQRYEKARQGAKTQQEMDAARDIGMAIWARANPKLAAKVKPGQSGYEVIQNEINAGQMGPVTDLPFDTTKPLSVTPVPPEQLNVTYQGISPITAIGTTPLPTSPTAFGRPQNQYLETFRQAIAPGPTFQGSPLAGAPETIVTSYKAALVSPLGGPLQDGEFRGDKARQMAQFYKNAQLGL